MKWEQYTVSEDLIATIAGYAAVENYGIVGMCARSAGDAIVELFGRENLQKGVLVEKVGDNQVDVSCMSHCSMGYPFLRYHKTQSRTYVIG